MNDILIVYIEKDMQRFQNMKTHWNSHHQFQAKVGTWEVMSMNFMSQYLLCPVYAAGLSQQVGPTHLCDGDGENNLVEK